MKRMAPLAGMLVVLLIAYAGDRALESARGMSGATVGVIGYQRLLTITNLVFAACILALGWLALGRPWRSRSAAVGLLVVGLLLVILPSPMFWGLGAGLSGPLFPVLQASPRSFFGQAAAFIAVLGVAGLVIRR